MSLANMLIIAILVSSAVHIVLSKKDSESDESTVERSRSSKEDDEDSDDREKSYEYNEKSYEDKDKSYDDNENESEDKENESEAIENESEEKDDEEVTIARNLSENNNIKSKVFIDLTLKSAKNLFDDEKSTSSDYDSDYLTYDSSSDDDSDYLTYDSSSSRETAKEFNFMGIVRQKFGVEAQHSFSKNGIPINMVCSPLSALLPLGKLSLGATGLAFKELSKAIGLSTEEQIMDHFKNLISVLKTKIGVELTIASQLFVSNTYSIREDYLSKLSTVFDTPVETVDFTAPGAAARAINKWVNYQTHGRIQKIASESAEMSSGANLAIVNAVFFQGEWVRYFKKSHETDFYTYVGKGKAQFMKQKGTYKYTRSSKLSSQVVQIPYRGDEASFVVILPSSKMGLKSLMRKFNDNPALLKEVIENLEYAHVEILLPKFTIKTKLQITDTLERIGVSSIFKQRAGLNRIAYSDDLFVSSAIQAAIIEVNEKGTMATAATGLQLEPVSLMLNVQSFKAQHPFYFLVMSKGEQLFTGAYFGSEIS